jgi:hypothetical protein
MHFARWWCVLRIFFGLFSTHTGSGRLPASLPALLPSTQLELSKWFEILVQGALYPLQTKVPHLDIRVLSTTGAVVAPLNPHEAHPWRHC